MEAQTKAVRDFVNGGRAKLVFAISKQAESVATKSYARVSHAMSNDVIHVAMSTWASKDLPARLLSAQVAKLLNCSTDDVAILVRAGKLQALGKPKPNAVKYFSAIDLISLLADPDWLDDATKTIGQYWRRKNASRNGGAAGHDPLELCTT